MLDAKYILVINVVRNQEYFIFHTIIFFLTTQHRYLVEKYDGKNTNKKTIKTITFVIRDLEHVSVKRLFIEHQHYLIQS